MNQPPAPHPTRPAPRTPPPRRRVASLSHTAEHYLGNRTFTNSDEPERSANLRSSASPALTDTSHTTALPPPEPGLSGCVCALRATISYNRVPTHTHTPIHCGPSELFGHAELAIAFLNIPNPQIPVQPVFTFTWQAYISRGLLSALTCGIYMYTDLEISRTYTQTHRHTHTHVGHGETVALRIARRVGRRCTLTWVSLSSFRRFESFSKSSGERDGRYFSRSAGDTEPRCTTRTRRERGEL